MKLISTSLLLLSAIFSKAQTPITLDRNDFPCPSALSCGLPDSVLYTNVPIASNSINTSTTGANSVWDMSSMKNGTLAYQNFYAMSATPLIFQLVFLSCDYAQPLLGNTAVGNLPVTDAYEYYNYAGTASSRLEIKGFGAYVTIPGQTTAIPLPAIYSSPDIVYQFPIVYGNTDSSNSGYSVTLPLGGVIGDVTFKRNQKRVNEVDGWGSITTPAGTFDALRVKSSITRMDSLITGFFPIGFPSSPIEYKWLSKTKRIPVFQCLGNLNGANFTASSASFWGQAPLSTVETNQNSKAVSIFPNPSSSNSTIEYELKNIADVDIFISDELGKTIGQFHFKHQSVGTHSEFLPMQSLPSGHYFIDCKIGNQRISSKLLKL